MNPLVMTTGKVPKPTSSRLREFWRQRVLGVVIAQLTQGVTPQKIALTIALGVNLGTFPILGATTFLCGAVGVALRLNQPVIQVVNWLMTPVQLTMILVFVRIGERIVGAPHMPFSVPELIAKFSASPRDFFREFGMTGVHGIIAWTIIAPFVALAVYFLVLSPLNALARAIKKHAV
jgi:uncharacterized protein (DUF2062 family)